MFQQSLAALHRPLPWSEYLRLCKPRIVIMILFTAVAGMLLAIPLDASLPWAVLIFGSLGISLAAASAAVLNHVVDRHIDAIMHRTRGRPLPLGQVTTLEAIILALSLGSASMLILLWWVNTLTAFLSLISLIGYAFVYSMYLKRATSQNIVIGGVPGAAPPMLGWSAVSGELAPPALLLFLIIFAWTPPHFWALSLYRHREYAAAGIPMLPVTHGLKCTRLHILLYTILLSLVALLPYLTYMSGLLYLAAALFLNAVFLYYAVRLFQDGTEQLAHKTFRYSILYLCLLFAALLADHYLPIFPE